MPDRPEDRARRVENVLETGDISGAMAALLEEMQGLSPNDKGALLKSLKEQNDAANKKDWTLPNVEIAQNTKWLGLKTIDGEYDVRMSHGAFEQAARKISQNNPFNLAAQALDSGKK